MWGWFKLPAGQAKDSAGLFTIERPGLFSVGHYAVFDNNATVSVEAIINDKDITLHPNPTTKELILNYSGDETIFATIIDAMGRRLQQTSIRKGSNTIDVSVLQSGVYFLNITGDGISTTKRFVKE